MPYVLAFFKDGKIEGWYGFSGKVVRRKTYATVMAELSEAEKLVDEWNEHFAQESMKDRAVLLSTDDEPFLSADDIAPED